MVHSGAQRPRRVRQLSMVQALRLAHVRAAPALRAHWRLELAALPGPLPATRVRTRPVKRGVSHAKSYHQTIFSPVVRRMPPLFLDTLRGNTLRPPVVQRELKLALAWVWHALGPCMAPVARVWQSHGHGSIARRRLGAAFIRRHVWRQRLGPRSYLGAVFDAESIIASYNLPASTAAHIDALCAQAVRIDYGAHTSAEEVD